MKRKMIFIILALVALVIVLSVSNENATLVSAAPRGPSNYTIDWFTVDGGGVMNSIGGNYSLSGTIGQPDAGTESGGAYTVNGGFWVSIFGHNIYLPLTIR